jgi:hypothetical protein
MSQRDVFNAAPSYVLPKTLGGLGDVLTVGAASTPNSLVWGSGGTSLFYQGVLNFVGTNTSNVNSNLTQTIISGSSPKRVATIFLAQSDLTVVTANPSSITAQLQVPALPLIDMTGPCSIYNLTTNTAHFVQYHLDILGQLTFLFDNPNISTAPGDNIFTQGFTLSFPLTF